MAKNDLKYTISAKDKSKQAFRSVQSGLKATNKAASLLKAAIGGLAVGLAVRRIAQFTNDAIKAGDTIAKTADKVGVGIEALQKLRFAADLAGISQEKLDSSLERFTKRIGEASQGTGEAKKALEILGVSFTDANGKIRPTEAVLSAVADAMASVETPAQRAALAAQLFGREGVGLVNLLKGGSSALQKFGDQAEAVGAVLSEDLARAAEVLNDKLTVSSRVLDVAKTKIGLAFAQYGVVDTFTRAVRKMADVLSSKKFARGFELSMRVITNSLRAVERNLGIISGALAAVFAGKVLMRVFKLGKQIITFTKAVFAAGIALKIMALLTGKTGKIIGIVIAILVGTTLASEKFRKKLKKLVSDIGGFAKATAGANAIMEALGLSMGEGERFAKQQAKAMDELTIDYAGLNAGTGLYGDTLKHVTDTVADATGKYDELKSALWGGLITPTTAATRTLKEYELELLNSLAAQDRTFGSGARAAVATYFDGLSDHASQARDFVNSAFNSLERTLADFFVSGEISFKSFSETIRRGLADIAAKGVVSVAGSFAQGALETVGGSIGRKLSSVVFGASGGYISGPGGDRSDNIPAMLSPGEFVVNAASVRKYGAGFFGALNANNRGAVDTDSELPGFGFGSFISKAFKSVTNVIKKVVGFVSTSIKGTIEGLKSGDPLTIAAVASSFILPGVMTAVTAATSAASAAIAYGGVMSSQGLGVAASLAGQVAGGVSAVATGITNGIANSFAQGILGGQFSALAVAQSLVGGQVAKLATSAVSNALGGGGFNRGAAAGETVAAAAAQGLLNTSGDDFSRAITAAFGRVVTEAEPFLDRRARGGPVSSGRPYLVGERGPEVFTPGRAGSVSPSMNASQIVDAVHEVRDEMSALRRQFGRALSGASLAGARA